MVLCSSLLFLKSKLCVMSFFRVSTRCFFLEFQQELDPLQCRRCWLSRFWRPLRVLLKVGSHNSHVFLPVLTSFTFFHECPSHTSSAQGNITNFIFSRVFDVLYEFCSWLAFTTFISPAFPSKSSWRPLQILLKVNIDNLPFCCLSFYKFNMFLMASTGSAQGRHSQLSFLLPVRLISSWRPLRVLLTVGSHNFLVSCLSITSFRPIIPKDTNT